MANPSALDAACRAWRESLGADAVLRSPEDLRRYGRTTLPDAPAPAAVVRARSTEEVVGVVRVAAGHRVPLYPISRGRNWGFGDACPPTAGQVVLDLSAMDRVVAVDEELGYAVVQPGVTQGQLSDELARRGSAWWFDWTAAGPDTSVLGNALERGITGDERADQVAGLEVVLGDGTVLRTGYGHFPDSRVGHLSRWGVGPALDGLFSQSNLGVVTELGFWLQPRPAHAALGYLTMPDAALEPAVDALRPLRLRGVVGALPLFLVPGPPGAPLWFGPVRLQGSPGAVAAHQEELTAALARVARVVFPSREAADDPTSRAAVLAALGLPSAPFFDAVLRRADPLAPPPFTPEMMLAFVGGPSVQRPTGPPASADPLDQGYGLYFAWLTCPALGREVRRLLDLVRLGLAADGFPPLMSLRLATGRVAVLVLRVAFDRKLEERRSAARTCHRAILEAAIAAGYPPARVGIDAMDVLDPAGSTYWAVVDRLKLALDPEGILAPGRYAPSRSPSP